MMEIAHEVYVPYAITDWKGANQLIVQCQNLIYGTMTENLLVEFTICVCRNLYGLTKTEMFINTFLSSLLDR